MGNKVIEVYLIFIVLFTVYFFVLIVVYVEDQFVEKEELDKVMEGYLVQNVKDIK